MTDSQAPFTAAELASLLVETGHHHHQAYIDSDGVDPEWALWYAGYLQTRIWDRLGSIPTRSAIVHTLVELDRTFEPSDEFPDWPKAYAVAFLDRFGTTPAA